mmetsp:Transcript_3244/g.8977  ORF Transcript_3244/g.8977 Transcript_3244/m.8977 type:complete len:221 (+) Transcript_3244:858-1520(+)
MASMLSRATAILKPSFRPTTNSSPSSACCLDGTFTNRIKRRPIGCYASRFLTTLFSKSSCAMSTFPSKTTRSCFKLSRRGIWSVYASITSICVRARSRAEHTGLRRRCWNPRSKAGMSSFNFRARARCRYTACMVYWTTAEVFLQSTATTLRCAAISIRARRCSRSIRKRTTTRKICATEFGSAPAMALCRCRLLRTRVGGGGSQKCPESRRAAWRQGAT